MSRYNHVLEIFGVTFQRSLSIFFSVSREQCSTKIEDMQIWASGSY